MGRRGVHVDHCGVDTPGDMREKQRRKRVEKWREEATRDLLAEPVIDLEECLNCGGSDEACEDCERDMRGEALDCLHQLCESYVGW